MASYEDYLANEEEINVNLSKVEACSGNLRKLIHQWEGKKCKLRKKFGDTVSQGYMANEVFGEGKSGKGMLDIVDEITDNTTILLENSASFFEDLKVTFEGVDTSIAKSMKD